MTGPIRGTRLPAEVKRFIVGAVIDAKASGMPIVKSCAILMIDPRRVRRWIKGRDPRSLSEHDLSDVPPIAKVHPHAITATERDEIVRAAKDERLAHLRHRKLTHTLSRQGRVFCSPSTTLRVLRAENLVPVYHHRSRPARPRPVTDESEPNKTWALRLPHVPDQSRRLPCRPGSGCLLEKDHRPLLRTRADELRGPQRVGQGARQRRIAR